MYKKLDHKNLPDNSYSKELMKISSATFGIGGYQDVQFGLYLSFESKGSGVCADISGGWSWSIMPNERSQWSEYDRTKDMAKMSRTIYNILKDAKVQTVDKLKGIPVEIIFKYNTIQSFRILEEVL